MRWSERGPLMRVATAVLVALGLFLARPKRAAANGGAVQVADQPVGPYRVTVTTSPNPLRVGTADVSILLLEGVDQLVTDATVSIDAAPAARPDAVTRYTATHQQATNPRYYAANVHFLAAGRWIVTVHVASSEGGGQVQFSPDVTSSLLGMTPFELGCTSLPALVIVAIVVAEVRSRLERAGTRRRGAADNEEA